MKIMSAPGRQTVGGSAAASAEPRAGSPAADAGEHAVKLLTAHMELELEGAKAVLSENGDFTVIGVLGGQGAGKSTLMSLLAGAGWASPQPDGVHGADAGVGAGSDELHAPPFAAQSVSAGVRGTHQTEGVDMRVTADRLILLDTQPLFAPSVMLSLSQSADLPTEAQSFENLHELHSLRMALLLLSVCHLVVFVDDISSRFDTRWLRTLRTIFSLRHGLADPSTIPASERTAERGATERAGAPGRAASTAASAAADPPTTPADPPHEYTPHLAFVFTRSQIGDYAACHVDSVRESLTRLLASESIGRPRGRPESSPTPQVYHLPSRDARSVASQHLGYRTESERLRDALLATPRRPFARPMSEREWLRAVGRVWEGLRKWPPLFDYNRTAQKMHLYL